MEGENSPKQDKKSPFKTDWTPKKIERALEREKVTPVEVEGVVRRVDEAVERWREQQQKDQELFQRGEEVMKDSKLTGINLELSDLKRQSLDSKISKTRRVKIEREIRKLEREKALLEGREAPEEEKKRKLKEAAAIPEFSESAALALLRTDDPETTLKDMEEKKQLSRTNSEAVGKVLQKIEEVTGFDDRANRLLELQRAEALPDAVFYAFASALLKEDQEGEHPIIEFRKFVRKTQELAEKYAGKEIPKEEIEKLKEEVAALGRAKVRFFRSKFGSRILANAEKPAGEKADVSRALKTMELLLGADERKVLEVTASIYEALNKEIGFTTSARSGAYPSYSIQSQFEIAMRMREWDERQKYGPWLKGLEEYLVKSGVPEIKQYVLNSQEKERRESALKKTVAGILEINAELTSTFGTLDPARLENITKEEKEGVGRSFREAIFSIKQTESLPLLEALLRGVLYLNDLSQRLETQQEEVLSKEHMGVSEVDRAALEREALALAREFEARDRLAHAADLQDALPSARNPAEERRIQNEVREKQQEAEELFKRAEQIRSGR